MTTTTRRRVQDTDGVVFTEHPSGRWVMEDDPDSYRRLIDTWDSYEQLLGDAVELTELEPAPAFTDADLEDPAHDQRICTPPMGIANEVACLLAPMHAGLCEPPVPTDPNAEGADVDEG